MDDEIFYEEVIYEGFVIQSAPHHLADSGRWYLTIRIWTGGRGKSRKFFRVDTFATREEAVAHGFNFGKQIIDGKVEGRSVNDL